MTSAATYPIAASAFGRLRYLVEFGVIAGPIRPSDNLVHPSTKLFVVSHFSLLLIEKAQESQ